MGAIDDLVERRIEAARAAGRLDGLDGHGRPIADLDRPRDPGWWARRAVREALLDAGDLELGWRRP